MALREPRAAPYRVVPARSEHMEEIARIEEASFLVPWKQEFFESEIAEPYRYARVLVAESGNPRVGGYLFAVSLYEEFHINKIATVVKGGKVYDPAAIEKSLGITPR